MKKTKSQGAALVWVIVIGAALAILFTALMSMAVANAKHTSYSIYKNQANYLARSGVYTGLEILHQKIVDNDFTSQDELVEELDAKAGSNEISLGSAGSFKIKFEAVSDNVIKIVGTGIAANSNRTTDRVTLTLKINMADYNYIKQNPKEWFVGKINNDDSQLVLKSEENKSYVNDMVVLYGVDKIVKSPQGGQDPGLCPASIIYFKKPANKDYCIEQQSNLTFIVDAEIVGFDTDIKYSGNPKDIVLNVDKAISQRTTNNSIFGNMPEDLKGKSFETYARYEHFINSYYDFDKTYENDLKKYWDIYEPQFQSGYKYGIVCCYNDIYDKSNNKIIDKGYYFFPGNGDSIGMSMSTITTYNNTSEKNNEKDVQGKILGCNMLIEILPDDPIIGALDTIFSSRSSYKLEYWDE